MAGPERVGERSQARPGEPVCEHVVGRGGERGGPSVGIGRSSPRRDVGAAALGLPAAGSWPVVLVLVVVGLGSLGCAALLIRASRRDDTAREICGPTAIANGIGAVALVVLLVLLWPGVTALGAAGVAVAATGCAAFAGAEWVLGRRPAGQPAATPSASSPTNRA